MVLTTEGRTERPQPQHGLSLRELQPERIPVPIEDRPKPLMAWVTTNQRYPATLAGELEDARVEYQNARERIIDGPPPPDFVESVRDLLREWENTPEDAVFDFAHHALVLTQALKVYDEVPRYKPANRAWETYVTRCLCALIPGLEEHEAELMPAPKRIGWLFELGYFTDRETDQPPDGAAQRPPEAGPISTGQELGPDLPVPIQ